MEIIKPIFNNRENTLHKIGNKEVWESRSCAVVAIILGLVKEDKNNIYVLAEKRSEIMDNPGKWCVPCGYIDWDENGWDAVRREVYEETSFNLDMYNDVLVNDHDKEPFYVMTEPTENRQNISLSYYSIYKFINGLPKHIEYFKNKETHQVRWINVKNLKDYEWAFNHNKRINMALIDYKIKSFTDMSKLKRSL